MITDVHKALNKIVGSASNLKNPKGAGRIFELCVMTGSARALQSRGYDVWVRRPDGSRILPTDSDRRFIQRGGKTSVVGHAR